MTGTYEANGSTVVLSTLNDNDPPFNLTGSLVGDLLTFTDAGQTLVFER
jgi:hypothetical protein